jgi:hypothetical protein
MEVSYQASNVAYPFVVSSITVISRPKVVFQHLTPLLHRECHSQPSNVFWDFVFTNLVLKLCDQHSAIVCRRISSLDPHHATKNITLRTAVTARTLERS